MIVEFFKRINEKIKRFLRLDKKSRENAQKQKEENQKLRQVHRERCAQKIRIDPLNDAEKYGIHGERAVIRELAELLPEARMKTNVIVVSEKGNAEIDIVILYKETLFAIEVKSWKGDVYEANGCVIKEKQDHYTGEIHREQHKHPVRQVMRAVSLLKENMNERVWINCAAYLDGVDSLSAKRDSHVFDRITDLVDYIEANCQRRERDAVSFFEKLKAADRIIGEGDFCAREKSAVVSLDFNVENAIYMDVSHGYSSDTVTVYFPNDKTQTHVFANKKIIALTTNGKEYLTLSGIKRIIFGKEKRF